ncbi:MAG TPA: ABC transporter substrate-binding protein [Acidimicrobiales bacterium]|nr:ABC transporter substrate-binding protein [Acidimicrobiales bacterium]
MLVLLGAMAMLVAACGADDESTSQGEADRSVEEEGGGDAEAGSSAGEPEIEDSSEGVTDDEVLIGIHAPETISGIDIGDLLGLGDLTRLYWDTINADGGVNGRKVTVELVDDGYEANTAQQACRDLVARKPFLISGTSGADQILTCAKLAVDAQMPYLSLGVAEAGLVDLPGYRAMTMTYDQMSALMAEYILAELAEPDAPVAMVRFNSPASEGAQSAFVDRMDELGGNVVATDAVDKQGNANELTAECVKLQNLDTEVVYMIVVPTASTQFARLCAEQGFEPKYVTVANTLSCATEPPVGVAELVGCRSFWPVRVETGDNALARQARRAWADRYPDRQPPNELEIFWGVFDVYREALDRAGRDLTRVGFLEALDSMKYDNGLFNPIDFGDDHVGADSVIVTEAIDEDPWSREIVSTWTSSFE